VRALEWHWIALAGRDKRYNLLVRSVSDE